MILLQRWSSRIMSKPLGKFFFHQNTLFSEKMSVQNKDLKFLSLVFWKINLRKLTLYFQIFHVIYFPGQISQPRFIQSILFQGRFGRVL